jgi:DNA uptake protein ComE-like DNA-binding protein
MVFLFLVAGRAIRHRLLITPAGQWREHLWLDEIVLAPGEAEASAQAAKPELTAPLPINSCSEDSLTLLPGVGPVLAGRIQAARTKGQVFRDAGDLRLIKGIGPALSARLAPLIDFTAISSPDSCSPDSP